MSNRDGDNNDHQIILTTHGLKNLNWKDLPPQFALVHRANKFLYLHKTHGSGFTRLIKKLDTSGAVQEECKNLLEQKGKALTKTVKLSTGLFSSVTFKTYMPIGTAWLTESGDLTKENVSHIIHAVGPNCNKPEEKEQFEDYLRMTYGNIFATITQYNETDTTQNPIKMVVCPSLSTDTLTKCDLQKSAAIAAETIFSIMNNIVLSKNENGPTVFIMIVHDDDHFNVYEKAFEAAHQDIFKEAKQAYEKAVEKENQELVNTK